MCAGGCSGLVCQFRVGPCLVQTGMDYDPTIKAHRQQMLRYLARDIASAKTGKVIIGFKISERDDRGWPRGDCARVAALEGVYLPDELPDLYPADCPREDICCCIFMETILDVDDTPESRELRTQIAKRGLPEPRPPWDYEKELAEVEEMERKKFAGNPQAKAKHFETVKKIVSSILGR